MRFRPEWHEYALMLAEMAASRSEDPWYQVGAVVLRPDNSVAGVGYNGAPSGVQIDWDDREARRPFVIHAEVNALRYCTPTDTRGGLLAVTHRPCQACLPLIAAHGIRRVFFGVPVDPQVYPTDLLDNIALQLDIEVTHLPRGNDA
jgi:dCMP deaminase